jgi:hypothetical protein
MSEAVIYKRLKLTSRTVGHTIEVYTPTGRWIRIGDVFLPGDAKKPSPRQIKEAVETWIRGTVKTIAETWTEARLNALQDAADRLEENYHPARRRWIAALIRAREVKP